MKARLARLAARFPDEVARGLYQETEVETTEVKRRTPVARESTHGDVPGALRASVHTEGPFREGRRIWTNIVAGGPAAPYAIYVHENPDAIHPVGQWKYIESVIFESVPYLAQRIANRIDLNKALEG